MPSVSLGTALRRHRTESHADAPIPRPGTFFETGERAAIAATFAFQFRTVLDASTAQELPKVHGRSLSRSGFRRTAHLAAGVGLPAVRLAPAGRAGYAATAGRIGDGGIRPGRGRHAAQAVPNCRSSRSGLVSPARH